MPNLAAGGIVMAPLLALSIVTVALVLERCWFWMRLGRQQRSLVHEVLEAYRQNPPRAIGKLKQRARGFHRPRDDGVTLGVGEALVSTAAGLVVAIVALAFANLFQGLYRRQRAFIQEAGGRLEILHRRYLRQSFGARDFR